MRFEKRMRELGWSHKGCIPFLTFPNWYLPWCKKCGRVEISDNLSSMKGTERKEPKIPGTSVEYYPEGKVSVVYKSGISPQVSEDRMKILGRDAFEGGLMDSMDDMM